MIHERKQNASVHFIFHFLPITTWGYTVNLCVKQIHFSKPAGKIGSFGGFSILHVSCPKDPEIAPLEFGWNEKLSNVFKPVLCAVLLYEKKISHNSAQDNTVKHCLTSWMQLFIVIVLVAFSFFFCLSSPGSGQYGYGDDEDWYSHRYKGDDMLCLTWTNTHNLRFYLISFIGSGWGFILRGLGWVSIKFL